MVTAEQYEHWKDFARRMVTMCFKHRRRPTWQEILENVECFFTWLDPEDLKCIVDWDNSDPYPADSPYYERTYRCLCWHCHGVKKQDCPYHRCEDGKIYDYAQPLCVADMCTQENEHWNPYYWADISDSEFHRREEQFCDPVNACIRAGLDMAVAQSAGVLGFSAGDLRRMYPEGVPDWVTGGPDCKWHHWLSHEPNGTFAQMANDAALVL